MNIGTSIRKLRMNTGKSQQEIADLLNIDRRTYAKWEEGVTEVKSSLVPKIAEVFGVDIPELYKNDKSVEIKDSFKDNNIDNNNAVIIVVTDKDIVEKVLDLLNNKN